MRCYMFLCSIDSIFVKIIIMNYFNFMKFLINENPVILQPWTEFFSIICDIMLIG